MGGTTEMFEIDRQLSYIYDDLPEVTCTLDPTTSKLSIIRYEILFKNINKEIKDFFKLNGIKFKFQDLGGAGGGGYSFIELVKELFGNFDIVGFIVSVWGLIKDVVKNFFTEKYTHIKPEMTIHLSIGSDKALDKINESDINEACSGYLISLLMVAESLCKKLKEEHNFVRFNLSASINLNSLNMSRWMSVNEKDINEYNIGRFVNIINECKMKRDVYSKYEFIKFNLIQRTDYIDGHAKKYYLLISSKLLKD